MEIGYNKDRMQEYINKNLDTFFSYPENKKFLNENAFITLYQRYYNSFHNPEHLTALFILAKIDFLENIDIIPEQAFRDLPVEELKLPDNIEIVDRQAFYDSTIRDIDLNKVKRLGHEAFAQCWQLRSIKIPEGVTQLKSYLFSECENLKTVYLPSTLEDIYQGCFYGCNSLKEIVYNGKISDWEKIYIDPQVIQNLSVYHVRIQCKDGVL